MFRHIGWVGARVSSLEIARVFFVDGLGLPVREDGADEVLLDTEGALLALREGGRVGADGNAVLSFQVSDVDAAMAALQARAVSNLGPVRKEPWGGFASFTDPDGNRWLVAQSKDHPNAPPGLLRLGWLSIHAEDSARLIDFYSQKLGIAMPESRKGWARFDTEGLTLEIFPGGTAATHPRAWGVDAALLPSFWVDDIVRARDDLEARGVRVLAEPRQEDWGGQTIYFADPEGNPWQVAQLP